MSLRPLELEAVAGELSEKLAGAVVQKAFSPSTRRLYLEVRQVGRSTLLCLCTEPEVARVSVCAARPPSPAEGSAFQRRLRTELTGSRLTRVEPVGARELVLRFEKPPARWTLYAELGGRGDLVLLDEEGRPLAASEPRFAQPRARAEVAEAPAPAQPSRLSPAEGAAFPLAEAAEALFAEREHALYVEQARRQVVQPLKTRLSRLERTLEKVEREAARLPKAEEHRQLGELLSQNLHRLERGAKEARLTRYTEAGPEEVRLTLDPARTPKQQVEWHFHQYRRLLRGSEQARARLTVLLAERDRLRAELAAALAAEMAPPAPDAAAPPPAPAKARAQQQVARPYKEYRARGGERILVGKGGADNDALTFKLARPQDLWLHARGVPGAHVVVPLEKGAPLSTELLLDAAHLALHHAQTKGEPRAEVSYTHVKFVKKVKGGAPGQVTYTREKTFLLRVEPARLERLLASQV